MPQSSKSVDKLAIHGGVPVRTQSLPWELPGAHWIDEAELAFVSQVITAHSPFRYYGPDLQHYVDQLEAYFRQHFASPYALAVNSGTSALHIALAAMQIGPGDEVLLPGYFWVSCVSAIVRLGAIPVLVDIDESFCMDPKDLSEKISDRSRAVLFVHMSGASGHIEAVKKITQAHNLWLLEDCAQAAGSKIKDKYAGTWGDAAIFSFQLNKNMTSGEGGMILCQQEDLYQRCFAIHDLGYARNAAGRLDTNDERIQQWGVGARMSELTAAMAYAQATKLSRITAAMRAAKWQIRDAIADIPYLQFRQIIDREGDSGCFLITLYPNAELCRQFTECLVAEGIKGPKGSLLCLTLADWGLHWYFNVTSLVNRCSNARDGFPWSHPDNQFAKSYVYQKGSLPRCDDFASRGAILAIPSCLTQQDITDIITAFHKVAAMLTPA